MIHCVYLLSVLVVAKLPTSAYAGGPDTSDNCYDLGYNQGQDKPFQRENYDSCERFRDEYYGNNPYYEGFMDGCKSVEDNTEEVCERATD
jgi:hypothetical protein